MLQDIRKAFTAVADAEKGKFLQRFFKTEEGQYGAGDIFVGITVPQIRNVAKEFPAVSLADIETLLASKIHEERLLALILLVNQFQTADKEKQKIIYDFYLAHTARINNWDLVDSSADKIVGEWLKDKDRSVLQKLAKSENIWERRIAMVSTFQFIKDLKESETTFAIADILLHDKEDLIQKAVGWMLREVEKRVSKDELIAFLKPRYKTMPRTALRYAIEHFPPEVRKQYLAGSV